MPYTINRLIMHVLNTFGSDLFSVFPQPGGSPAVLHFTIVAAILTEALHKAI